ncbi:MAG: hypothetical protein DHS20C02_03890 [Micavibrio sp.]|nr:MAG: hypothetical protein DHS20C02_03890 [Micavibrio sp.]
MGGKIHTITTSLTALVNNPDNSSIIGNRDSQLLFGETFEAESESGEWVHGTSIIDGYKGHVRTAHLAPAKKPATHFINQRWTHIYPEASFKTRPVINLGLMSRLSADDQKKQDGFVSVPGYGWASEDHIKPLSALTPDKDFVETALSFLGCPYLYGGRSAQGLDCSALAQIALLRSGISCPRDSDQQINLGITIEKNGLRRGDLVFFKGHVGIMVDDENILNATSRTMDVRIEALDDLENIYKGITRIRRIA